MGADRINVLIPMGGLGSRFAKSGYDVPKPLVPIFGRTMISWLLGNLALRDGDIVFVALQRAMDAEYGVSALLLAEFGRRVDLRFVFLDGLTRGAAETLYKVTGASDFPHDRLICPTISLDCDTLYFCDVLGAFRALPAGTGCCAYFRDTGDKPIFSYIAFEPRSDNMVDIREKQAISRNANTGAYGFPSAALLNRYVIALLQKPLPAVGEFYTSALIHSMLGDGVPFRGLYADHFDCVGTPAQLVAFFHAALGHHTVLRADRVPPLPAPRRDNDEDEDKDKDKDKDKDGKRKETPITQTEIVIDVRQASGNKAGDCDGDGGDVLDLLTGRARSVVDEILGRDDRPVNVAFCVSDNDTGCVRTGADGTKVRIASAEERRKAEAERRVVGGGEKMEKEIGWYLSE